MAAIACVGQPSEGFGEIRAVFDLDRFAKISEVEGIKLTPAMKKRASDARSKGLTAEEYRRMIIRSHSKG